MKLPKLESPRDYVGWLVYDFGDHVSVGYTAEEIAMLRRHPAHGGGRAYLVHAVDDAGRMALRGATEIDLFAEEAMVFGHATSSAATASFDQLVLSSRERPIACPVKIESARDDAHEHRHVVVLIYKSHSGSVVSAWLLATGFVGGDWVTCGAAALVDYRRVVSKPIASRYLTCRMSGTSRSEAEVLNSVHLAIQR